MDRVETHIGTVAYRRAGAGAPLVLLHGGLSDGRSWTPQLESLAREYDVVAWDAPGCGGSADPTADLRLADYADAVAALVRALGDRRLRPPPEAGPLPGTQRRLRWLAGVVAAC